MKMTVYVGNLKVPTPNYPATYTNDRESYLEPRQVSKMDWPDML